jgi:RimJ/RimL family protein N-acetyltransferase
VGATCEGVLRRSFLRNGEYLDQHLWSILDSDWRGLRQQFTMTIN